MFEKREYDNAREDEKEGTGDYRRSRKIRSVGYFAAMQTVFYNSREQFRVGILYQRTRCIFPDPASLEIDDTAESTGGSPSNK